MLSYMDITTLKLITNDKARSQLLSTSDNTPRKGAGISQKFGIRVYISISASKNYSHFIVAITENFSLYINSII